MFSSLSRLRTVLAVAAFAAVSATAPNAATIGLMEVDEEIPDVPQLVQLVDTKPIKGITYFEIQMDGQGNYLDYYMNMTRQRFTNFHFWWEEPIDPPITDGGPFFLCHGSDEFHADFKKCWGGTGINVGQSFGIEIVGFRPNEVIVVWPTVPIPMPAVLLMSGLALTGALGLRRRKPA